MSELSTDVQMTEPWPEPAKLPSGLPEVMSFNEDMLPASLRPWVNDIAERMQCPPDYIAATAMVVAGALVGRKIGIRPKQHDDWLVIPNLFGLIVGRPSLMKTPAMREVLNILTKFENQAREKYEADLAEHELVQDVRDIQKKAAREELRKQAKKSPDAEEEYKAKVREMNSIHAPVRQRYMTTNATVEKLGEILRDNPNGVLIHMDELIGFLRSMDRDGHECDRSFYLTAWDGCGRYTYDRIGRGTVEIEAAIVSIIGSIQPGVIASYVRGAVAGGTGDDGLIQRFQVMVWPEPPPGWSNVDHPPDPDARKNAVEAFERLDRMTGATVGAMPLSPAVSYLRFQAAAQARFDCWRTALEMRLRAGGEHPAMEAHLAKYRSLIPSLALILHLLDDGKPEVTLTALERAIAWGEYLESHARRIYTSVTASADLAARAIGQKLLDGELETQFAARDVYRKAWAGLTDKDVVHGGLDVLVSRKWLEERVQETGGRRATVYVVNPRLTASVAAEQPTEPTEEASVSFVGAAFGAPDYDGDNAANINNPTSNHNRR